METRNLYSHALFALVLAIIATSFAALWLGGKVQLLFHDFIALVACLMAIRLAYADFTLDSDAARRQLVVVAAILGMVTCIG